MRVLAVLLTVGAVTSCACPDQAPSTSAADAPPSADAVRGVRRAAPGESCSDVTHFIFAVTEGGQQLACRGDPPRYELSATVIGVRELGAGCDEEGLAQSPDGSPMLCLDHTGQRTWQVYLDY